MQNKLFLWCIGVVILNFNATADTITTIRTAKLSSPVRVGVFKGLLCGGVDFNTFKDSGDFRDLETNGCHYVEDKVLDPQKPNATLKVWHLGSAALTAIATQDGKAPAICPIAEEYKTLYIGSDSTGLICTSPEAKGDDEDDDSDTSPEDVAPPTKEQPSDTRTDDPKEQPSDTSKDDAKEQPSDTNSDDADDSNASEPSAP